MKLIFVAALSAVLLAVCGCGTGSNESVPKGNAARAIAADATIAAAPPTPTLTAGQVAYVNAVATMQESANISMEQTVAAEPTSTPVPPPHDLSLISASCRYEFGFTTCEGSVRNDSGTDLDDVEAVVESKVQGVIRSSDEALIDFNPVLSGQTSPWKVIFNYNPAYDAEAVIFKTLGGGTLITNYCKGAGGTDLC